MKHFNQKTENLLAKSWRISWKGAAASYVWDTAHLPECVCGTITLVFGGLEGHEAPRNLFRLRALPQKKLMNGQKIRVKESMKMHLFIYYHPPSKKCNRQSLDLLNPH